jgi:hypothetical protein
MSRRHHGRPNRGRHRHEGPRPEAAARPAAPQPPTEPRGADPQANAPIAEATAPPPPATEQPGATRSNGGDGANVVARPPDANGAAKPAATNGAAIPAETNGAASPTETNGAPRTDKPNGCTAPQLRRFIKSRPYVPMHELRRRFAIDGSDDDVTQVDLQDGRVYVGLPAREGSLLGELLRGGEIGYELSFDPLAPIVVGVYPMRPVPRT